jgi:hypothetical protein
MAMNSYFPAGRIRVNCRSLHGTPAQVGFAREFVTFLSSVLPHIQPAILQTPKQASVIGRSSGYINFFSRPFGTLHRFMLNPGLRPGLSSAQGCPN